MKRFSLMTAAAALSATSAVAYTGVSPTIFSAAEDIVREAGLDADLTQLTDEQIIEVYAAGTTSDDGERIQKVRGALEGTGAMAATTERRLILVDADEVDGLMPQGENSVVMSVQNWLDRNGFEADASTLSDAQIAEIYLTVFGGEENEPTSGQIEAILGS